MMSAQINACWPHVKLGNPPTSYCLSSASRLQSTPTLVYRIPKTRPRLVYNAPTFWSCTPVCLFGSEGKPKKDNESSPWGALEKAMGGFRKERSVQDLLREQMQERELDDVGGAGNRPGGGGGDGSGDSEDEGFTGILDEFVQVILATIGFILMYIYIIRGEEITRLIKDYIKYLFGASKSVRLRRAMFMWGRFYTRLNRKKRVRRDWLERAILSTPTYWHDPRQIRRLRRQIAPYQ